MIKGTGKTRVKKTEYILVDGYNIIHAWQNLKAIADDSLEDARRKLIHILSDFSAAKGFVIIVVFDAHRVKKNVRTIEHDDNIKIVYTKEGETADHYIEKTVGNLTGNYTVRVATSDYLQQMIVIGRGAYRISAREFLKEIEDAKKEIRDRYIDNKPVKKNLLMDNLDPKTAAILEQMRRQGFD